MSPHVELPEWSPRSPGCGARGAAYVLLKVRAPGLLMV